MAQQWLELLKSQRVTTVNDKTSLNNIDVDRVGSMTLPFFRTLLRCSHVYSCVKGS